MNDLKHKILNKTAALGVVDLAMSDCRLPLKRRKQVLRSLALTFKKRRSTWLTRARTISATS
jgi:hypothetical protein